jgi:hypothetical protein
MTMKTTRQLVGVLALVVLALPVLASSEPSSEDLDRNRRLLEKWRADPEHYARLKRDLKAFHAMPRDRQDRLRKLDHDLSEADSRTQRQLWNVMERYANWFDRLPEADRQRIEAAGDREERLHVVQTIREQQLLDRLPRKTRDELAKLPEEQRRAELVKFRKETQRLRREWRLAMRPLTNPVPLVGKPAKLADFPADVQAYVRDVIKPQLSATEKDRLNEAEGKWPQLAQVILELAEKHPLTLPGPVGPMRFRDLPADVRQAMPPKGLTGPEKKRLQNAADKWPDYAVEFTRIARQNKVTLPRQLGPCTPKEFAQPIVQFIDKTLLPKLLDNEKNDLKKAEGQWPEYPRKVLDLAHKHKLEVPGMKLPGPPELWEKARSALPELPDRTLRDFAAAELTAKERADLQLSADDPDSRERLKEAFFKKHPRELERLKKIDRGAWMNFDAGPSKPKGN